MKRSSPSYRLQMIKEVASRQQSTVTDPMANYIQTLLSKKSLQPKTREKTYFFWPSF